MGGEVPEGSQEAEAMGRRNLDMEKQRESAGRDRNIRSQVEKSPTEPEPRPEEQAAPDVASC